MSDKGQDLIYRLVREKEIRLCSKRYQTKERRRQGDKRPTDWTGHHVYPDDAEDIKVHRWFRHLPWDRLHTLTPPFVPQVRGPDDTRYFEDSGSIDDDMSDSEDVDEVSARYKAKEALKDFPLSFQDLALGLVAEPYDAAKLQSIDQQIDLLPTMSCTEKDLLKQFVRLYGVKESKRPRDKVLRDRNVKDMAMDVRKKTAFMGYTWRRVRPEGYAW